MHLSRQVPAPAHQASPPLTDSPSSLHGRSRRSLSGNSRPNIPRRRILMNPMGTQRRLSARLVRTDADRVLSAGMSTRVVRPSGSRWSSNRCRCAPVWPGHQRGARSAPPAQRHHRPITLVHDRVPGCGVQQRADLFGGEALANDPPGPHGELPSATSDAGVSNLRAVTPASMLLTFLVAAQRSGSQ